jgi:hypothetical protein
MFNNPQPYIEQNNPQTDVVDFLSVIAKDAIKIKGDLDFQSENCRVLVDRNASAYDIVRRIGRTEERFDTEIKLYFEIWKRENNYNSSHQPPVYSNELEQYRKELSTYTDFMPELIAIKYGKEKVTSWALDKIKTAAEKMISYYGQNWRWQ